MIIEKAPYWETIIDHYYDNIHWEQSYDGIYDWLEQEYTITSNTGSTVLHFKDEKKATFFVIKFST